MTQPVRQVSAQFGAAQGPGPIYPVGPGPHGVLSIAAPTSQGSLYPAGWDGQKVLWIAAPAYTGPVLIRGIQLGGNSPVAFQLGDGSPALPDMQFPPQNASATGWRNWPSATLLKTPGCYAWQIDGTTFSTVVVFKAKIGP